MVNDLALRVNGHDAAQCKPVLSCIQGTDSIGQCMGQHRNHTVNEIYTGSAVQCLHIQCTVLLHIVGYIGNVNPKFIKITLFCERDRIIKVFCVLPIDRDRLPVTQIHAPSHVCSTDFIRYIFHLFHNLRCKFCRQVKASYNG